MIRLTRILVATDFSEPSQAALSYGRELARAFGAHLQVVNVVDHLATTIVGPEGYVANLMDMQHQMEGAARQELDALISDEDRRELAAKPILLMSGAPALAIVRYAKEAAIDLIVMGTHGRGALGHFLMGSVAEKVVRSAPCPVLTVRHPEHEFVLPDALVAIARTA
ncbi:MAG: putative universal stress protein [Acidobacteria bacterium]|nr:putative universal stress protein [Acidobacteriota bacterium]